MIIFMYDKNEQLICSRCQNIFEGRRPPEGIDIICPNCVAEEELQIIDKDNPDIIPAIVHDAIEGGGEDGSSTDKKKK